MKRPTVLRILFALSSLLLSQATADDAGDAAMGPPKDRPSFSFRYANSPFETIRAGWSVTQEQTTLDDGRRQRITTYHDPRAVLSVRCEAMDYPRLSAREWLVWFENHGGEDSDIIEEIRNLDIRLPGSPEDSFLLHYALGDHNSADSFAPQSRNLPPGEKAVFSPRAGRSSDPYLPFFNLQGTEGGMIIAIGWSGQWQAAFERNADGSLEIRAGLQTAHFKLRPGEKVRTARIVTIEWKGDDPLAGNNRLRQFMLSRVFARRNGELVLPPVCASTGEVDPNGSYEGPHVRIMPFYARCGIEVFWSDMDPQQWYPRGFPVGTGTWEPDVAKYPRGLKPIGDAAHAAGLGYLLWFEPERAQPDTRIYNEHPEFLLARNGQKQLYALHDPVARKWLTDYIDVQIRAAQLDWIRWDFNIEPLEFWRQNEPPDRRGIIEIGYVMGLYAMWEDLQKRHPGLVIDNCASGGRRIDIESCRYGLPLWHSDMQCFGPQPDAEQLQNAGLFRWVPLHGCAAFGLEPSYAFRSAMTAGNILVLPVTSRDQEQAIKQTVAVYNKVRPLMLGDFYPLFAHQPDNDLWFGYQFHRRDTNRGMAVIFRRGRNLEPEKAVRLRGLNPDAAYEVGFEGSENRRRVKGRELADFNVQIPEAPGSLVLYYQQKD
ncbi:MAG: alpha-galactosidase [Sedimentisphaerales bacterium]|nr:alpha-galactosidase [Sedimentisphaerales bacterium]